MVLGNTSGILVLPEVYQLNIGGITSKILSVLPVVKFQWILVVYQWKSTVKFGGVTSVFQWYTCTTDIPVVLSVVYLYQ